MNWYKIAQEAITIDDLPDVGEYNDEDINREAKYFNIGHGEFVEELGFKPDFLVWILLSGEIHKSEVFKINRQTGEAKNAKTHRMMWGDLERYNYKGRYEPQTGRLSLVKPESQQFRDVPNEVMRKIRDAFPKVKKIIVAKNNILYKTSQEIKIEDFFSLNQFEDMMKRAYNLQREYLQEEEPPINSWQEWIKNDDSYNIALSIESEHSLYSFFLKDLPEEITVKDLIDAYKENKLKYKPQGYFQYQRPDLIDVEQKETELMPWSKKKPHELKNEEIIQIYKIATSRLTKTNTKEITEARKSLFALYSCDKDLYKKLNINSSELNKKMRTLTGITVKALDIERQLNNDVPDDHQWAGITNTSFFGQTQVDPKDLDKFVKKIEVSKEGNKFYHGNQGEQLRRYIAMSFLGIDTKIKYDDLSFEIGECEVNDKKVGGLYDSRTTKIIISNMEQRTVSHEIGHYLDYKFAKQFFPQSNEGLSTMTLHGVNMDMLSQRIHPRQLEWFRKYGAFVKNLMSKSDVSSEYTQRESEVFARFVDKFVKWTISHSQRHHYYSDYGERHDKFTDNDYRSFVMILQEKSWIDKNYPIKEEKS